MCSVNPLFYALDNWSMTGENIDEFPVIRQYFPIKIFCLVSYLYEMNE